MTARPAAVARSATTERALGMLLGVLAVAAGTLVLLIGAGVLGANRASRPLVDPIAVDAITRNRTLALAVAIAAGIVLVIFGLWATVRSVRPETKPDVALDSSPANALTITAGALADAVRADAETVTDVHHARVRVVGDPHRPGVRLTLSLRQGADIRQVWSELDTHVLSRAREALGIPTLPTAVRIELDTATRQRAQ